MTESPSTQGPLGSHESPIKITLVEDEPALVFTLQDTLESEGYKVQVIQEGAHAVEAIEKNRPNLIVLDLMLPGKSGFEICEELRAKGNATPILMLTAREAETDKVKGLTIGADDYVTKPFSVKELLARIQALLRRTRQLQALPNHLTMGDVEIDLRNAIVTRPDGTTQDLSTREVQIIQYLMQRPNEPVSRDELLEQVWRYEQSTNTRTVDVHISKLRSKIEGDGDNPKHLVTLHGVGYMLKDI